MERPVEAPHPTESRTYEVELMTALGKRSGELMVQLSGEMISGILRLMKVDNPIQGRFSEDGTCSLTGSITTRMNSYPFEGSGQLLPERIEMLLRCMGLRLPFRGIRKQE